MNIKKKFRTCIYKNNIQLLNRIKKNHKYLINKYYFYIFKTNGFLSAKQNEIFRRVVNLVIKKKYKKYIFPQIDKYKIPTTKKSLHSRMGKGKAPIKKRYNKLYINKKVYVIHKLCYADTTGLCRRIEHKLSTSLKKIMLYNYYGRSKIISFK